VDSDTVNRLIELNRQFYQTFAAQFSSTRQRIQPGVRQIIKRLSPGASVLDLGCGNGELWRVLKEEAHLSHYVGADFSAPLLEFAGTGVDAPVLFIQADLSHPDWRDAIPGEPFEYIFAFAVLHHLPSQTLRRQALQQVRQLLIPEGVFFHSEWQFLNSPRLKTRIQAWEKAGISPDQVEAGDYLLDWRHGGAGLRYVHHFTLEELEQLAQESGFQITETFFSDGEGGKLGLYQTWEMHTK
jgi:tRNA (uracil-5-)-methyltransferase TRM9